MHMNSVSQSFVFTRFTEMTLILSTILALISVHIVIIDGFTQISTVAGTGATSSTSDGSPALSTNMYFPSGVWTDTLENIYYSEAGDYVVKKVDHSTTLVSTVTGTTNDLSYSGIPGPATSALIGYSDSIFGDSVGTLCITDYYNMRIYAVALQVSTISVFAGTGASGGTEDNGQATAATFYAPYGVWCDSNAVMYVADAVGKVIRAVTKSGIISLLAGSYLNAVTGGSGDGGAATAATFTSPRFIFGDSAGKNLYFSTAGDNKIRAIVLTNNANIISSFAGSGTEGTTNIAGAATTLMIDTPSGVFGDTAGNIFIADTISSKIKQVDPSGIMTM